MGFILPGFNEINQAHCLEIFIFPRECAHYPSIFLLMYALKEVIMGDDFYGCICG